MVSHDVDLQHLRRCVELAGIALKAGHGPFGAMLVGANGQTLYEDHNRVTDDDQTLHAELGVDPLGCRESGSGATYSDDPVHVV